MRLCRRLAALPQVQRAARFLGSLFEQAAAPRSEAETVFQSEPAAPAPAAWAPSRSNLYGPN